VATVSRRWAFPSPDGPGAPPLGCSRDPLCRIDDPEHGGECDARTERERAQDLYRHLDAGLDGYALTEACEAESRASMMRAAERRN